MNMQASALKSNVNVAAREFFQVALVTYLLLTLAETMKPGFVSNFFEMNYLLLVVLVTGIAMVLTEPIEGPVRQAMEKAGAQMAETAAKVAPQGMRPRLKRYAQARRSNVVDLRPKEPVRPLAEIRREQAKAQAAAMARSKQG